MLREVGVETADQDLCQTATQITITSGLRRKQGERKCQKVVSSQIHGIRCRFKALANQVLKGHRAIGRLLSSEKGRLGTVMDVTGQGGQARESLWLKASRENKEQHPSEDKGKEESLF